jgi:predicted ABC-type transport system involved in lysophospholipase L1 biosynthesis ATPase subunit
MAMLLGLVRPSAVTATVLGASVETPASYLRRVGALIEAPAFWPGLSGIENLGVLSTLGGHDASRIPELLTLVGLDARGADRFGGYSFGMNQRLGIAAALLADPALLVPGRAHQRPRLDGDQRDARAPRREREGRRDHRVVHPGLFPAFGLSSTCDRARRLLRPVSRPR